MDLSSFPAPHEQTASTIVDDQAVIILADSAQVTILNEIGARVWQLSDGTNSIHRIIQLIVEEFEVSEETAMQDVQSFLQELADQKAIVFLNNPQSKY
jgi:hypothetical protein